MYGVPEKPDADMHSSHLNGFTTLLSPFKPFRATPTGSSPKSSAGPSLQDAETIH